MNDKLYKKLVAYCRVDLASYIETDFNNATLALLVDMGKGDTAKIEHLHECAWKLYECDDLMPKEHAAAWLLAVVTNDFLISWQRSPNPPDGNEKAPPLEAWQVEELSEEIEAAVREYAAFLPDPERVALLAAVVQAPPAADAGAGKVEAVIGVTKGQVIGAFQGLHFNADQWSNALGKNIPKWLKECQAMPGKQGDNKTSATWNPVLIAAALYEKGIAIRKLDAVFVGLKDWADEWREVSDMMR